MPIDIQDSAILLRQTHQLKSVETTILNNDESLYKHCIQTSKIAAAISRNLSVDTHLVCIAGRVHDIGKIYISKSILLKPGPLTKQEREEIDKHSMFGYQYLKNHNIEHDVCDIVLMHHGMYHDGHRESSVLAAEVLRAADILDALTSARPYHQAISEHDAYAIMQTLSNPLPKEIMKEVESYIESF